MRQIRFSVPVQDAKVIAGTVAIICLILVSWEATSHVLFVVDSPSKSLLLILQNVQDSEYRQNFQVTAFTIGWAFAIGIGLGTTIGILLGLSPVLKRSVEPSIVALHSLPKIIVYPVIIGILGIGAPSRVALGTLTALFPIMLMVTAATSSIPPIYLRMAESLRASRRAVFAKVIIPAILRPIVTGVRLGVSVTTTAVVLGEFFVSRQGVGRLIVRTYEFGQYDQLFATVILLVVLTFLVSFILWKWERRLRAFESG